MPSRDEKLPQRCFREFNCMLFRLLRPFGYVDIEFAWHGALLAHCPLKKFKPLRCHYYSIYTIYIIYHLYIIYIVFYCVLSIFHLSR